MNSIEALARMLPNSQNTERLIQYAYDVEDSGIAPTALGNETSRPNPVIVAELAGALAGLNQAQEQLIWCKYLGDNASCAKGLQAYRAQLQKDKALRGWIFMAELPAIEKLEDKILRIIDHRASASAILSSCAYTDMVGSFQCDTCNGAGEFELPDGDKIQCTKCHGKGHQGRMTTARMRADKLHMSLRSYHRKFHQPYVQFYWSPLKAIETAAIKHIASRL